MNFAGYVTGVGKLVEDPRYGQIQEVLIVQESESRMTELSNLSEIELQILECLPRQNPPAVDQFGADMDEIAHDVLKKTTGRTRTEIQHGLDALMKAKLVGLVQYQDDDDGKKKLRWRYGYCIIRGRWREVRDWLSPKTAP